MRLVPALRCHAPTRRQGTLNFSDERVGGNEHVRGMFDRTFHIRRALSAMATCPRIPIAQRAITAFA